VGVPSASKEKQKSCTCFLSSPHHWSCSYFHRRCNTVEPKCRCFKCHILCAWVSSVHSWRYLKTGI
ncbi:unnamed protein product, partial [Tetraodon nigroviridis]